MKLRRFDSISQFETAAADRLRLHMQADPGLPHAVMLSGGRTPAPLYRHISRFPFPVSPDLYILLSDERRVPLDSPDSNQGMALPMITALGIPSGRVLGVNTALDPEAAAEDYARRIEVFFSAGGRITLALLGLGPDGHTASLFTARDLASASGRLAMAVRREVPPDRVSVTPAVLACCEHIVFLVAGPAKRDIVTRIQETPEAVIAGQAVHDAPDVELWFAE